MKCVIIIQVLFTQTSGDLPNKCRTSELDKPPLIPPSPDPPLARAAAHADPIDPGGKSERKLCRRPRRRLGIDIAVSLSLINTVCGALPRRGVRK